MLRMKGLIAAVVTPMTSDGEVDLDAIDSYAEFLIGRGVKGVFVNGTTGESMLLDTEERKAIAERWMKFHDRLKILVHVGSTSYKVAQELAKHAEAIGADAISAMAPCFLQPSRAEELVAFNEKIAAMAPDTPYYFYNIPGTSGCHVDMRDFLTLAEKRIPNLNGIKYTSYDSYEMLDCIRFGGGRYDILHGHDETLVTGLLLGATGGIGTSYNIASRIFNRMLDEFQSGNVKGAVDLQYEANKLISLMLKYVNSIVGVKAMLEIMGIHCGPCRLPLRNLTREEKSSLEKEFSAFSTIL